MALFLYLVVLLSATLTYNLAWKRKSRPPYPPGPKAEPIIGHARIIPPATPEVTFREWSKIYGDVIHLWIPGRTYIVLNSLKSATELLEERSGIYSDRMRLILFELMGWTPLLGFLPYGKHFQKLRRLMNQFLHKRQSLSYESLQIQQSRLLVGNLLNNPQNWETHLQLLSTALITKVAFGKDVVSEDDPYMDISHTALKSFIECGSPGSTMVDFFPSLRFFPFWFPGTRYVSQAKRLRSAVRKLYEYPFEVVKHEMDDGTAQPSYLSHYLSQLHGDYSNQEHIEDIKGSAASMFVGGAETTTSSLSFFFLTMTLYPECQKKAQKEIDNVLGRNTLPEFKDRKSLPYVEALLQEIYRWNPILPTGVPHRAIEDDVYNGMFIPKGAVILVNALAILHDESIYANPEAFNPSRYLPKPEGNAEPFPIGQFGFGRRICPGRHFADGSLWIAIATILATLHIGRANNGNGNEIVPAIDLDAGMMSHPKPFPCTIKPRDHTSQSMIQQAQMWANN